MARGEATCKVREARQVSLKRRDPQLGPIWFELWVIFAGAGGGKEAEMKEASAWQRFRHWCYNLMSKGTVSL